MNTTDTELQNASECICPRDYKLNDDALTRADADNAFLRALGFKDVSLRDQIKIYDDFEDRVERAVLDALDALAEDIIPGAHGWKDDELENILPGIRKHAKRLWEKRLGRAVLQAKAD